MEDHIVEMLLYRNLKGSLFDRHLIKDIKDLMACHCSRKLRAGENGHVCQNCAFCERERGLHWDVVTRSVIPGAYINGYSVHHGYGSEGVTPFGVTIEVICPYMSSTGTSDIHGTTTICRFNCKTLYSAYCTYIAICNKVQTLTAKDTEVMQELSQILRNKLTKRNTLISV